jgi:hypothetical protein
MDACRMGGGLFCEVFKSHAKPRSREEDARGSREARKLGKLGVPAGWEVIPGWMALCARLRG